MRRTINDHDAAKGFRLKLETAVVRGAGGAICAPHPDRACETDAKAAHPMAGIYRGFRALIA